MTQAIKNKKITFVLDGFIKRIALPSYYKKYVIKETISLEDSLTLNEFIRLEKSKLIQ